MRIAVAQILSGTDPADNLQLVRDYTGRAAESGASLVVFPEATMCRFGVPLAPIAEPVDGGVDGVAVGLTTCYDLRFPELFSTLARRGAQLIVVSASWAAGPGKL